MNRSKKVILVAHCLLNPNTQVLGSAENKGPAKEVLELAEKHDYGIIQLPCPEIGLYPADRKPKTREMYDTPEYRRICRSYAEYVVKLLNKLREIGVRPIGVIGVKYSPSCGVNFTLVGHSWATRRKNRGIGIFMQELREKLHENEYDIPFVDFDFDNPEESIKKIEKRFLDQEMTLNA